MTGTGFDGLVVDHRGLEAVGDHLRRAVKAIDDRLDGLERELSPLRSEWSGSAQVAYQQAKATWDSAITEMTLLLSDTGTTVGRSNQEYHAADLRGASSFRIG